MDGDDLDVNMLDDLGVNAPDETSESKAKHALRALDLSKPATDNILHPEMRRELFKIHRNLGHPSLQVFVRALKHAVSRTRCYSGPRITSSAHFVKGSNNPLRTAL